MQGRIKIFTRSFDLRLYTLSRNLYLGMGIPTVRLTDKSADGYFYAMLSDMDCDIAINVDEDAFITDPQAVLDLVQTVVEGGYANAGCSDGDPATTGRDPVVTNPFFNVFNLSLIRTRFDRSLIRARSFGDAEPYYPFFHWLAAEFKTLYLPCRRHPDGITTVAMDAAGRDLCVHSWYSRFYSMPTWMVHFADKDASRQKERIDALIKEAYDIRGMEVPGFGFADNLGFFGNKVLRWTVKIPQRISRWPFKVKRLIFKKKTRTI